MSQAYVPPEPSGDIPAMYDSKFRNVVAAQERLLNAMEEMLDVVRR